MDPNRVLAFIERFHARLCTFSLEEKYCDVCIHVEGKSFKCHRLTLMLVSKYFETMFGRKYFVEHKNYDVTLHETDAVAFKEVIRFSYTGLVCLTGDNVFDVLRACDFFEIDNYAEEQCVEFMWQSFHSIPLLLRVVEILRFACSANKPAVIEVVAAVIAKNVSLLSIHDEKQFLELTFDEFEIIVSQRWYMSRYNEHYFVEVFCSWLKHVYEKKTSYFRKLIWENDSVADSYKYYISESNMRILVQIYSYYRSGLRACEIGSSFPSFFIADNIRCVELTSEILLSLVYLFFFLDPENRELFLPYFFNWYERTRRPESRHNHPCEGPKNCRTPEECWSETLAQVAERLLQTMTIEEPKFVINPVEKWLKIESIEKPRCVMNPPATKVQRPCSRGLHMYTRTAYKTMNTGRIKWFVHSVEKNNPSWKMPYGSSNYKYLRAGGVAVGDDLFWLRYNNDGCDGTFERRSTLDVFSPVLEDERRLRFPPCCSYLKDEHRKSFNMCNVNDDIYLNIVSHSWITPGRSKHQFPHFTDEDIARALHRYSIYENQWYSVPTLDEVREKQSSICAYGCALCLVENTKDASNPILRIQMLDCRAPIWLKFVASPPLEPGYRHSTSCVHDRRIYVCADDNLNSQIRVFDVRALRWDSSEDQILRRAYRIDNMVSYENVLWAIGKSGNSIQVETFNSSVRRWSHSPVAGTIGANSGAHTLVMDSIVYNYV